MLHSGLVVRALGHQPLGYTFFYVLIPCQFKIVTSENIAENNKSFEINAVASSMNTQKSVILNLSSLNTQKSVTLFTIKSTISQERATIFEEN